jgi:hypothetical protein
VVKIISSQRSANHDIQQKKAVPVNHKILSAALKRSMNSIIESGSLPVLFQFLPTLMESYYFPSGNAKGNSLSLLSSPHHNLFVYYYSNDETNNNNTEATTTLLSLILNDFFQETFAKLSQMVSPSLSEENSCELMLTMTKGLKMILMIPLQYLFYYQMDSLFELFFQIKRNHSKETTTTASANSIRIVELESFQNFLSLFRLFLQLEDLCYERNYYLPSSSSQGNPDEMEQSEEEEAEDDEAMDKDENDENSGLKHYCKLVWNPFNFFRYNSSSVHSPTDRVKNHKNHWHLPVLIFQLDEGNEKEKEEPIEEAIEEAEDEKREEMNLLFMEKIQKLFYFIEKLYLIILEYSLLFQQKLSSNLFLHQSSTMTKSNNNKKNENNNNSNRYSIIAMKCYSFLFSMNLSLLFSFLHQIRKNSTPPPLSSHFLSSNHKKSNKNQSLILSFAPQFKEYSNYLIKIMKEIMKLNYSSTSEFIQFFVDYPLLFFPNHERSAKNDRNNNSVTMIHVIIGLFLSFLLSLSVSSSSLSSPTMSMMEEGGKEMMEFLMEKIHSLMELNLAKAVPNNKNNQKGNDLDNDHNNNMITDVTVHDNKERKLQFFLFCYQMIAREFFFQENENENEINHEKEMILNKLSYFHDLYYQPTTMSENSGGREGDAVERQSSANSLKKSTSNKGKEEKEVIEIDEGNSFDQNNQNNNKRKFIEIHDQTHLESIIENSKKKQIKQGIVPILYNSNLERGSSSQLNNHNNVDQQSQDNHYFSFPSQQQQLEQEQLVLAAPKKGQNERGSKPSSSHDQQQQTKGVAMKLFPFSQPLLEQEGEPQGKGKQSSQLLVDERKDKDKDEDGFVHPSSISSSQRLPHLPVVPPNLVNHPKQDQEQQEQSAVPMAIDQPTTKRNANNPVLQQISQLITEIQSDYQSFHQSNRHSLSSSSSSTSGGSGTLLYGLLEKSQQLQLQLVSLILQQKQIENEQKNNNQQQQEEEEKKKE